MNHCSHTQVFTVFGGSYISESHGSASLPLTEGKSRSVTKMAAVIGLLALGLSTATATKAPSARGALWLQSAHSSWTAAGFELPVY
jgi:hypothetical protein